MSIKIMDLVWALPLPDSEKIVLLALADYAKNNGTCWPSIRTIAEKCSKAERTVQYALSSLEQKGHLTRVQKPGAGCIYTVHPRNDCTPDGAKSAPPAKSAPVQGTTETPATVAPKPSRTVIRGRSSAHAKSEPKPKPEAGLPWHGIPEWIPLDAWHRFLSSRRDMNRYVNADTAELIIADLAKLKDDGHPPGAVLDQTTKNGWLGVFPLDAPGKRNQRNGNSKSPRNNDEPQDPFVRASLELKAERAAAERG